MLGIDHPFLVDLVETVIQSSESAYPELREHDAYIKKVIGTEEEMCIRDRISAARRPVRFLWEDAMGKPLLPVNVFASA